MAEPTTRQPDIAAAASAPESADALAPADSVGPAGESVERVDPVILRERMLARDSHRHSVHYDREAADEIAERVAQGDWRPLPLGGRLIEIDTTTWPDLDEVLATL